MRHDVRLDDARDGPAARLDQRLGDLRRRRDRDGLARGDRRRSTPSSWSAGTRPPNSTTGDPIIGAVVWIALMTWICYRGIELSARIQQFLLTLEVVILAHVRGRRAGQGLRNGELRASSIHPAARRGSTRSRSAERRWSSGVLLGDLHLLGLGLGRRRQRGVRGPGRGAGQGGGALDGAARADLRRRDDRRRRPTAAPASSSANANDVLSPLGTARLRQRRPAEAAALLRC